MKQVLIASTFAAALMSAAAMTGANAAENSQQTAQQAQTQQVQEQAQVKAQPGPVAAQQGTVVSPVYEVPGRTNRAGSTYFGQ